MITFTCDTRCARRASLFDMHQKYSSLHANGFIDGYMARVASLPDREI